MFLKLNNMTQKEAMTLQDYTTEELKAELKRRSDLVKAEKAKVKRCRMCKHWGEIYYSGTPTTEKTIFGLSRCCRFFPHKKGKYFRCHPASQPACEHFEPILPKGCEK